MERKRHIGNDICVVIFVDGKTPYSPKTITSEFNSNNLIKVNYKTNLFYIDVFIVIQPFKDIQNTTYYRMEVSTKDGVPPFGPPVKDYYTRDDLREELITKRNNYFI